MLGGVKRHRPSKEFLVRAIEASEVRREECGSSSNRQGDSLSDMKTSPQHAQHPAFSVNPESSGGVEGHAAKLVSQCRKGAWKRRVIFSGSRPHGQVARSGGRSKPSLAKD